MCIWVKRFFSTDLLWFLLNKLFQRILFEYFFNIFKNIFSHLFFLGYSHYASRCHSKIWIYQFAWKNSSWNKLSTSLWLPPDYCEIMALKFVLLDIEFAASVIRHVFTHWNLKATDIFSSLDSYYTAKYFFKYFCGKYVVDFSEGYKFY